MSNKDLAVMLRWLQREAALAWRDGAGEELKGSAIAYGRVALYIESTTRN
jgi:hypothetical protein